MVVVVVEVVDVDVVVEELVLDVGLLVVCVVPPPAPVSDGSRSLHNMKLTTPTATPKRAITRIEYLLSAMDDQSGPQVGSPVRTGRPWVLMNAGIRQASISPLG